MILYFELQLILMFMILYIFVWFLFLFHLYLYIYVYTENIEMIYRWGFSPAQKEPNCMDKNSRKKNFEITTFYIYIYMDFCFVLLRFMHIELYLVYIDLGSAARLHHVLPPRADGRHGLIGCNGRLFVFIASFAARFLVNFFGMETLAVWKCIARTGDCNMEKKIANYYRYSLLLFCPPVCLFRFWNLHVRGQNGHLNGFSPVCWFIWNFKSWLRLKFLLQMAHWCGRVLLCEISCCLRVEFDG